ncbi:hypothetical protein [Lederbergia ruris]|nr:hypothetical protein [Lederbergia ruris]
MIKRKYGDRAGWKQVLDKEFCQLFLDSHEFIRNITLLRIHKVKGSSVVQ